MKNIYINYRSENNRKSICLMTDTLEIFYAESNKDKNSMLFKSKNDQMVIINMPSFYYSVFIRANDQEISFSLIEWLSQFNDDFAFIYNINHYENIMRVLSLLINRNDTSNKFLYLNDPYDIYRTGIAKMVLKNKRFIINKFTETESFNIIKSADILDIKMNMIKESTIFGAFLNKEIYYNLEKYRSIF